MSALPHRFIFGLILAQPAAPVRQIGLTQKVLSSSIVKRETDNNENETELCKGRHPSEYFRLTADDDCRDVVRCSVQGLLALRCPSGLAFGKLFSKPNRDLNTNRSLLSVFASPPIY